MHTEEMVILAVAHRDSYAIVRADDGRFVFCWGSPLPLDEGETITIGGTDERGALAFPTLGEAVAYGESVASALEASGDGRSADCLRQAMAHVRRRKLA